ncbi:DUF3084 domain-containing protein [Synechococcus sp. CS-1325]|uniref:DUF3084 domain-containing protein n=1 Tax=unclassified Synechococcus TaxID=2626047 RepID=UPI000DB45C7B|nr:MULTISPECIES: DUF3084 domain-containing protein [unclassified Synechococcus]PZU96952.1 MAG: DUF3084 domain-containing protein [Cyanobium sp.]MCT0200197.1 DUF3084 domain-containing protein [Synechococcus sp. CS-1325]MCT0212739.1 DUF3084 domain-containing protein [Synechococcus sp. CS-1326]MCT0230229.1 DUF3084 domain-containing protein [Synechococcus sp. CS-1324]MCT0233747.1 DUF3084 domain-containing protein [Synechococcus sp. CS-1327]
MSGWLLILALLVLGGVLATLGDRLGSRIGKARLSLFNLRPRNTAVLITVLTGSLISAISLGLMLAVSERLRVGLFELDALQLKLREGRTALDRSTAALGASESARLRSATAQRQAQQGVVRAEQGRAQARQQLASVEVQATQLRRELQPLQAQRQALLSQRDRLTAEIRGRDRDIRSTEAELARVRQQIKAGEAELKGLETKLIALRQGDVVITSGQALATAKVALKRPAEARPVIEALLRQANLKAFERVLPGQPADSQILLVPRADIVKLEGLLGKGGSWVVSILSAANVLRGERQVLGFPDLRQNRTVIRQGDVMATTSLEGDELSAIQVRNRLNLLLTASFARAQRQGSVADGVQFDVNLFNRLGRELSERPGGQSVRLEAVAVRNSDTPDPIFLELRRVGGTAAGTAASVQPRRP